MRLRQAGLEVAIGKARRHQVGEVVRFMREHPEVCFCEWEDEALLRRAIARDRALILVAEDLGEIIGVLIGGSFGVRATINHVAVAEGHRRRGIASALVERAFAEFKARGIARVFLFVLRDNPRALRFWGRVGFHPTDGEQTLEVDL